MKSKATLKIAGDSRRPPPKDGSLRAPATKRIAASTSRCARARSAEFIGQERIKKILGMSITAARERGEVLDHVLFSGPPGLGKTSLAHIIARELGVNFHATSGPAIERAGDLAAIVNNLEERDVLFIDEIHRLRAPSRRFFIRDGGLRAPHRGRQRDGRAHDEAVGQAVHAGRRDHALGTAQLAAARPLRPAFSSRLLRSRGTRRDRPPLRRVAELAIDEEGAHEIAARSRGTPRIANRLLRRVRDFAQVNAAPVVTREVALGALELLEIDACGFDRMDRAILAAIIDKFDGGPVGVESLAAAVGEESDTIEEVYEPYLLQEGFVARTSRGRVATQRAYAHLGRTRRGTLL